MMAESRRDSTRRHILDAAEQEFLTHGYSVDPAAILRSAMFQEDYRQMVIVRDIELYSLCEHHMLPFFGKAHVAYIPDGRIVGLLVRGQSDDSGALSSGCVCESRLARCVKGGDRSTFWQEDCSLHLTCPQRSAASPNFCQGRLRLPLGRSCWLSRMPVPSCAT